MHISTLYIFQVVFPKSDAQRQALADSVKDILLFRSLDKVRINSHHACVILRVELNLPN